MSCLAAPYINTRMPATLYNNNNVKNFILKKKKRARGGGTVAVIGDGVRFIFHSYFFLFPPFGREFVDRAPE